MLGAAGIGRDEGQIDLRLRDRGKLDLGLFRGFLQPLERHLVLAQIDALVLLELVGQPLDDPLVEIVAAQERVAVRRLHFEHAFAEFEDGDVERAAAQVVDRDGLVLFLVEAVGQRTPPSAR